ncbi:MAG: biopolymer transporter TolR, partial [Bacteroidota bacterium]|nr:biopolymer transporter TolR [Bacteroidota bacterium]
MKNTYNRFCLIIAVCIGSFFLPVFATFAQKTTLGIFEGQTDVGRVRHAGTGTYNSTAGDEYELSGSGTNMWGNHDEFHFVWKRMKGDFILYTRGELLGKGVDPHRKIGWIVRQSLD